MSAASEGAEGVISIVIGPGELVDRLTILRIKADAVSDHAISDAVALRLAELEQIRCGLPTSADLAAWEARLARINRQLWDAETSVRQSASRGDLGEAFIAAAREILELNDERASIKSEIDLGLGWSTMETKSYG